MSPPPRPPKDNAAAPRPVEEDDDDEPDPWDQRIEDTGCSAENERLNSCFYDKKDWRACKDEMAAFKECWQRKGNADRTAMKDNTEETAA